MSKKVIKLSDQVTGCQGELEIIVKDRNGNVVHRYIDHNIIKLFAKEMLAKRIPHPKVWDPGAAGGIGAWIDADIDPNDEFTLKYILFGASFDDDGNPLDQADTRFYVFDDVTGQYNRVQLSPGATNDGGLINPIPIADPNRPLKRIESVEFEPTYQPAGAPLFASDVRAINNKLVVETTILADEYNGFGRSDSDFFTLTEVALAGGRELGADIGACECDPHDLFLEPTDPLHIIASGTNVVSLDPSVTEVDLIKTGDQVKLVDLATDHGTMDQISPYYLVLEKAVGGRDITLDRIPADSEGTPITGDIGAFRDTYRLFAHRILAVPVKVSEDFQITVRWSVIFS